MPLLLNTLARFVTAFLLKSKWFLFCFNFMAAVTIHSDFGAQENKMCLFPLFSPCICHEVMGLDAVI